MDPQKQRQTKNKILVDPKILENSKDGIAASLALIILIEILSLVLFGYTLVNPTLNNLGWSAVMLIILIALAFPIGILFASYGDLKDSLPKRVRKIIKVTTIYEDGTKEERKRKYEY